MNTIQSAQRWACECIEACDANLLLQAALDWPSWKILAHPAHVLSEAQWQQFKQWVSDRATGMPVAYLLGHQPFWTLDLEVNAHTLIPRADTEVLVEVALSKDLPEQGCRVIDLGTGSGAIALALKKERPQWQVLAIDQSHEALTVAKRNAQRHALTIQWQHGNWLSDYHGDRVHLIVSNPPYIAPDDQALSGDIRYEPLSALVADNQGLADYEQILTQAKSVLLPAGWLMFEHGYQQASALKALAESLGWHWCQTHQDLAGHPRVSVFRRKS